MEVMFDSATYGATHFPAVVSAHSAKAISAEQLAASEDPVLRSTADAALKMSSGTEQQLRRRFGRFRLFEMVLNHCGQLAANTI